jgi:uncharacterized protein (DUF362 family)
MKQLSYQRKKTVFKIFFFLALALIWIGWDLQQANQKYNYTYTPSFPNSEMNCKPTASANVAIVRSDNSSLANPSSITSDLSQETIDQMVRRAINLAGGFSSKIRSGMTVLIKPNLVACDQLNGNGTNTDVRVVEAVVKLVDEVDHGKIKILVGDGSAEPYTTYEKSIAVAAGRNKSWTYMYGNSDPTKDAGYHKLPPKMTALGIDMRLTNLNGNSGTDPRSELKEVKLPGGGTAQPQKGTYMIHQDVLNADVFITVPVMKIHDTGITCALKNQIGLAPSTFYGFYKATGVVADNKVNRLIHTDQAPLMWTDKEIVDLSTIAKIKYVVVDALMCLDVQKTTMSDRSNQVRMNLVLAGEDPVAVDNVCARVMSLNPDDVEHITLAERMGLGTNDNSKINIVGEHLSAVKKKFRKQPTVPHQIWGQGNREWLISSAFDAANVANPIDNEFIPGEANFIPQAGINGWSKRTYFINDRIDLKTYFNSSLTQMASYAFSYFTSINDQDAELWIGSDDPIKVYINGILVYSFTGSRAYATSTTFLSEIKKISLKKGLNTLLVKTIQKSSTYDFALNICEVEPNTYFRGNRVEGLKFTTEATVVSVTSGQTETLSEFELLNSYPNPFNGSVQIPFVVRSGEQVSLDIYDMLGAKIKTLFYGTTGTKSLQLTYWNGKDELNRTVSSGTYLAVLKGDRGRVKANRILFLK